MPNARIHMIIGAVTTAVAALLDDKPSKVTHSIVAAPLIGEAMARLPDILEPALHPNHRQFFHSITTLYEGVLHGLIVLGGVAYISHLLADGSTPKGHPLFGKLSGG